MQFILSSADPSAGTIETSAGPARLRIRRNTRARRYILRVVPPGEIWLTLPRSGSVEEGLKFARRQIPWIARRLQALAQRPGSGWLAGPQVLFRGQWRAVTRQENPPQAQLEDLIIPLEEAGEDLRQAVERRLISLAEAELPGRARELADEHELFPQAVRVKNQKTRWGSCSAGKVVSLNWRLVQTPQFVRDYIILHELAHLIELNHSPGFWQTLGRICPNYGEAEAWLRAHAKYF